jgi:hypothetical protein
MIMSQSASSQHYYLGQAGAAGWWETLERWWVRKDQRREAPLFAPLAQDQARFARFMPTCEEDDAKMFELRIIEVRCLGSRLVMWNEGVQQCVHAMHYSLPHALGHAPD